MRGTDWVFKYNSCKLILSFPLSVSFHQHSILTLNYINLIICFSYQKEKREKPGNHSKVKPFRKSVALDRKLLSLGLKGLKE